MTAPIDKSKIVPFEGKIYSLHHPDTGELRYIGQTKRKLCKRLKVVIVINRRSGFISTLPIPSI
jgi:hypothetical protein